MPTMAVVTILAAGAGLAFLVRSIISLEDAIDQDNEVSVQDYADNARRPFSARLFTSRRCLRAATANSSRWASTGLLSVCGRRATSTRPPTPEH